jgi:hypothetical protein
MRPRSCSRHILQIGHRALQERTNPKQLSAAGAELIVGSRQSSTARRLFCGPTTPSTSRRCGHDRGRHRRSWSRMTFMEVNGLDVRPEPLEERRKRLSKLLSRSNKKCATASNSARRQRQSAQRPRLQFLERLDRLMVAAEAMDSQRLFAAQSCVTNSLCGLASCHAWRIARQLSDS